MFDQNTNRDRVSPFTTLGQNAQPKPLRDSVKQAIHSFLKQLDGQDPEELEVAKCVECTPLVRVGSELQFFSAAPKLSASRELLLYM